MTLEATPAPGSAEGQPASQPAATITTTPRLDADALLDGEGIRDDAKYEISAAKLKEVNAMRKAFREAGIDPALTPNVIKAALAYVEAVRAQPAQEPTTPPTEAEAQRAAENARARKALHELDPEIPAAVQVTKQYIEHTKAHAQAVAADAREILVTSLGERHLPNDGDALTHIEELMTASIQEVDADWVRFMRGIGHERIIKRHLEKVLKTVTKLGGGDAAARTTAALEKTKRATAALPPRLPSGSSPGGPSGSAPNAPPRTLKEADERVRARFAQG